MSETNTTAGQPLMDDLHSNPGMDHLADVPVDLHVEVGRRRMTFGEVLCLGVGALVELDTRPGDPLPIYANGTLIAYGEVVIADDRFGVKIRNIVGARVGGSAQVAGGASAGGAR